MSGVVKHKGFRNIERLVNNANDAALGLLIGDRIARSQLAGLATEHAGSPLSDLFAEAEVEDITRFDFLVPAAIKKLSAAERELCVMAIPFAVSLYNEYLVTAAQLLELAHVSRPPDRPERIFLGRLEAYLKDNDVYIDGDWAALMRFVRQVRNNVVHSGAAITEDLLKRAAKLPPKANAEWSKVTGRPIPLGQIGDRLAWAGPEIRGVFLVIRAGLTHINQRLRSVLPREFWADLLIHELWVEGHQNAPPSKSNRSLVTTARMQGYGALDFEASELREADSRYRTNGWRPDLRPYWQRSIPAGSPVCQPVTTTDLSKGRLRIAAEASDLLPVTSERLRVKLREVDFAAEFRPARAERSSIRSAILHVGPGLSELVARGQTPAIFGLSGSELGIQ